MPVIPPELLHCVFYLYRDKKDALAGVNTGGTGFFLSIPTPDSLGHHYGVTNWHVAVKSGFSCVRINTTNGPEVFEFDPSDWIFEPRKDDIAIVPLDIRGPHQVVQFVGTQLMLTQEHIADHRIGPGDEVFMVGRFVDLDMRQTNVPALRFGNISTLPVPVKQPTKYTEGLSYCIDMHSRSGYSGSPVFVYRTPGNTLEWAVSQRAMDRSGSLLLLLGIHWGQFSEELPIKRKEKDSKRRKTTKGGASASRKLHEEYIEGLTGMTCVIPAWRIAALLEHASLRVQRVTVKAEGRI